jgi:hypothetical protein
MNELPKPDPSGAAADSGSHPVGEQEPVSELTDSLEQVPKETQPSGAGADIGPHLIGDEEPVFDSINALERVPEETEHDALKRRIHELRIRINAPAVELRAWNSLTEPERYGLRNHEDEAKLSQGPKAGIYSSEMALAIQKAGGIIEMWQKVRTVSFSVAVLQLAHIGNLVTEAEYQSLLWKIRQHEGDLPEGRSSADHDTLAQMHREIIAARDQYPLVLVVGSGTFLLYWNRNLVDVKWSQQGRSKELLEELVKAALSGRMVARSVLSGCKKDETLKNRKHRLKNLLPPELAVSYGEGSCALQLASGKIKLFENADGYQTEFPDHGAGAK